MPADLCGFRRPLAATATALCLPVHHARLTNVVVDSQTTGLNPRQGDEIGQLGAGCIVNGHRGEGEVFDAQVNPGRPIPRVLTEVQGITEKMVADATGVAEVVRRFHKFAVGAVLAEVKRRGRLLKDIN